MGSRPSSEGSTRDGRMDPWTDSCDVLKGAGDVVVTHRRDKSWRKWLLVNSGRECYEMKVLQAKEGKTMRCLKPFDLSKHIEGRNLSLYLNINPSVIFHQ